MLSQKFIGLLHVCCLLFVSYKRFQDFKKKIGKKNVLEDISQSNNYV